LKIHANGSGGEIGGHEIKDGDWISLDGETGEVALGRRDIAVQMPEAELAEIDAWGRRSTSTLATAERDPASV
jgi:pyruvate,orthophosphate dikinase